MDYAQFIDYFNQHDRFSVAGGMRLTQLALDEAEVQMQMDGDSLNFMGTLHGGAMATLADTAAGCAALSRGQLCVTLSANLQYVRPARKGRVTARARQIHHGRTLGVCEVRIYDEQEQLLCTGTYSMFIRSEPVTLPETE